MDCRTAKSLMQLAIDNELKEDLLAQLDAHLISCTECSLEYDALSSDFDAITLSLHQSANSVSLSDEFSSIIISKLAADSHSNRDSILPAILKTVLPKSAPFRKTICFAFSAAFIALFTLAGTQIIRSPFDSRPSASPSFSTGHLVSFSVHQNNDGTIIAGINAHRYCQIPGRSQGGQP